MSFHPLFFSFEQLSYLYKFLQLFHIRFKLSFSSLFDTSYLEVLWFNFFSLSFPFSISFFPLRLGFSWLVLAAFQRVSHSVLFIRGMKAWFQYLSEKNIPVIRIFLRDLALIMNIISIFYQELFLAKQSYPLTEESTQSLLSTTILAFPQFASVFIKLAY